MRVLACESRIRLGQWRVQWRPHDSVRAMAEGMMSPALGDDDVLEAARKLLRHRVREVSNDSLLKALCTQLDAGESGVIALGTEIENAVLILDDKKVRRVASEMGLRVIGTVGILLKAKHHGLLSQVRPLLRDLDRVGFRLSPELQREALRLAGEEAS